MSKFVGGGWETKFSINIQLKKSDLDALPLDRWGNIFLAVGRRKSADEKTKQTHFVKVDDYRYEKLGIKQDEAF